jgi:hypothetical protein
MDLPRRRVARERAARSTGSASLTRTRRPPNDEERAILEARAKRAKDASRAHDSPFDLVVLAVLGLAMILGAQRFTESLPRGILSLFGASLLVIAALGARRQRTDRARRLADLDARHRARAATVEEISFTALTLVTASDPGGDGNAYWIFALPDGTHLAFTDTQWIPGETPPTDWRREVTTVLDGERAVVALRTAGDALPVSLHHLRAQDFSVTDESRFWAPDTDGGPPWVVSEPVLRRLGDLDDP